MTGLSARFDHTETEQAEVLMLAQILAIADGNLPDDGYGAQGRAVLDRFQLLPRTHTRGDAMSVKAALIAAYPHIAEAARADERHRRAAELRGLAANPAALRDWLRAHRLDHVSANVSTVTADVLDAVAGDLEHRLGGYPGGTT